MNRVNSDKGSRMWEVWWLAPSVRATGTTKQGAKVVVYAHENNYFSNPANVKDAVDNKKLVNGAGPMPQDQFYSLLEREGNGRVFVVDYDKLKRSSSSVISVDDALYHPQTIPFLGSKDTAERYLVKHRKVYGDKIGVWHTDDLEDEPMARMLFLGISDGNGLSGDDLDYSSRLLGVAPEAQSAREREGLEGTVEVLGEGKFLRRGGRLYMPVPEGLDLK
ncbi:hypothetical protein HYU23_04295 [Candidatus Woesearchaeota archaeon]|nr:hypothetical protein [Candidatus Woesearchaeota archaeon]